MSLVETGNVDYRSVESTPIHKFIVKNDGVTSDTEDFSVEFYANGVVREIKYKAPDLTTDANYTFQIRDANDLVIYQQTTIADNGKVRTVVADDDRVPLAGKNYKARWSWVTSQTVAADQFEALIGLANA